MRLLLVAPQVRPKAVFPPIVEARDEEAYAKSKAQTAITAVAGFGGTFLPASKSGKNMRRPGETLDDARSSAVMSSPGATGSHHTGRSPGPGAAGPTQADKVLSPGAAVAGSPHFGNGPPSSPGPGTAGSQGSPGPGSHSRRAVANAGAGIASIQDQLTAYADAFPGGYTKESFSE